jgi:Flp pilus assembly protein TadD
LRFIEAKSIILSSLEVGAASAEAVWVFELNARRHPDSWNAHDSRGEAYLRSGRTKDAIR